MQTLSRRTIILFAIAVAAIVGVFLHAPIPQDPTYHLFADHRRVAGVDNFWNVVSNIPFLLVGLYGLSRYSRLARSETRAGYAALCLGVLLVSFGSAYYHLAPSTPSLLWDRLPMTIAFMALFSLLLDERAVLGKRTHTLWPLLAVGVTSAVYWYWTESQGAGDLRAYVLVQFLPVLLIPIILLLFPARYLRNRALILASLFYVIAKVLEHFDRPVFQLTGAISGHTLKHLAAGVAVFYIVIAVPINRSTET